MFDLSTLAEPIVQAPMGGGPSTPQLAIAVCRAGGLGFLAAGYKHPDTVRGEIEAVRGASGAPFGVNLFVPSIQPADPERLREYTRELAPDARRHGVELGEPRHDDDGAAVAAVLCAGASAAQLGTALMLAPEVGTAPAQRALLGERSRPTMLTRAFSGRLARGIVNRFMQEHTATAPVAYPEIHHLTSPLRAKAREQGDADAFNL